MPTKRQRRAIKRLSNLRKQKGKFPELLSKIVEMSDIILEVLDARFIDETRNKEIEKLIKNKGKKILYVLNKADLVEKEKLKSLDEIKPYVFVSAIKRTGGKELRDKIKILSKSIERSDALGRFSVGVIGYPNTGKSSIINLLIGKNSAKTGAAAGFTKGIQKLKLTNEIVLIDSPGVIPAKEYSDFDQKKISQHAMVGARDYHKIKDPEIVVSYLVQEHKSAFENFYEIEFTDSEDLIEKLGRKKNFFKKGGVVNTDRTAREIIKEWQEGKIRI